MSASRSKAAAPRKKISKVPKKDDGMLRRLLNRKAAKETAKMSAVADVDHVHTAHTAHTELESQLAEIRGRLQKSEERYQAFIRLSTEGIWRLETEYPIPVDLAEDEQIDSFFRLAHFAECNDALAKMYGCPSAKDVEGAKLSQFLQRDDAQNIDYLRAFIRSGYALTDAESRVTGADGTETWFASSFMGIVENGQLTGAWGVQRDITALKKAEQEIHLLNGELERNAANSDMKN